MSRRRTARRTLGVALVLAPALLLLWSFAGMNVVAKHHQSEARAAIVKALDAPSPASAKIDAGRGKTAPGLGLLSVKSIGIRNAPIAQGFGDDVIDRGLVGHVGAMPGEGGHISLAGHVVTHGEVFKRISDLRRGDLITLRTADGAYRYRVTVDPITVDKSDPRPMALTGHETLSLISCKSRFARSDARTWVQAEPIKEKP
jgi:sortase A